MKDVVLLQREIEARQRKFKKSLGFVASLMWCGALVMVIVATVIGYMTS